MHLKPPLTRLRNNSMEGLAHNTHMFYGRHWRSTHMASSRTQGNRRYSPALEKEVKEAKEGLVALAVQEAHYRPLEDKTRCSRCHTSFSLARCGCNLLLPNLSPMNF